MAKLTLRLAVGTDHDVLEHGQAREQGQVLEGPGDPELGDAVGGHLEELLVLEVDPAAGRLVDPRHDVEERRLAGAVGPDQAADLAPLDGEGELVEGHDAAEADAHVTHVENRQRLTIPHAKSAAP